MASVCIFTKYHGPTNTKGARISAWFPNHNYGRHYFGYDHSLNDRELHRNCASVVARAAGYNPAEIDRMQSARTMDGFCHIIP